MIETLASVSFAFPAALWALLALPVIWWLLRFTPPRPQRIAFPPFRLLRELTSTEEQPDRTPWWLILLRLAFAGLIILAIARPMLGANDVGLGNARPLLVVLDDGWAAARDWQKRMNYLSDIVANGEQQGRLMALATTTPKSRNSEIRLARASTLKSVLGTLAPHALNTDRVALLERLRKEFAGLAGVEIIWLSDGVDAGTAGTFAAGLAALANGRAAVSVVAPESQALGAALSTAAIDKGGIKVTALRPSTTTGRNITLRAVAGNGRSLVEQPLDFGLTDLKRDAVLNLPLELRNELARIEIAGEL